MSIQSQSQSQSQSEEKSVYNEKENICLGNCSVCLESMFLNPYKMINITATTCGHKFHTNCLLLCNELSGTCPLCRNNLVKKTKKSYEFAEERARVVSERERVVSEGTRAIMTSADVARTSSRITTRALEQQQQQQAILSLRTDEVIAERLNDLTQGLEISRQERAEEAEAADTNLNTNLNIEEVAGRISREAVRARILAQAANEVAMAVRYSTLAMSDATRRMEERDLIAIGLEGTEGIEITLREVAAAEEVVNITEARARVCELRASIANERSTRHIRRQQERERLIAAEREQLLAEREQLLAEIMLLQQKEEEEEEEEEKEEELEEEEEEELEEEEEDNDEMKKRILRILEDEQLAREDLFSEDTFRDIIFNYQGISDRMDNEIEEARLHMLANQS